jgi:chloramphenicol 3-O phosphotransferase
VGALLLVACVYGIYASVIIGLNERVDVLHDYPVLFIRVDCDRDELFKRARQRGYTTPERLNQIDQQLELINKRNQYDLIINTSTNSTNENVLKIKTELNFSEKWLAFKKLKLQIDNERKFI